MYFSIQICSITLCKRSLTSAATSFIAEFSPTTESIAFRDLHEQFQQAGTDIYGISRDSLRSHEGFKSKLGLPFELISDPEEAMCLQFGVMKMKNMYGKQVRGVERSTFVIDADGKLMKEWRGVKVPNHAEDVLEFVKSQP